MNVGWLSKAGPIVSTEQPQFATSIGPTWTWPTFWLQVQADLKQAGYRGSTRRVYRNVLRGLRSHAECLPAEINRDHIRAYLRHLARRGLSASWMATNLSVIRNVFDRFHGAEFTRNLRGPRSSSRLPHVISQDEMHAVLEAAESLRDRLLLGLMYGCGLKVGEACRLRWRHIDIASGAIAVHNEVHARTRHLPIPRSLLPILREGATTCPGDAWIFQGRKAGAHLSVRMAEYLVHRASRAAGMGVPVTSMTLRHSFAVHCLEGQSNIREVQEALGHLRLETTMIYTRLMLPDGAESPLDRLRSGPAPSEIEPYAVPLDPAPLLAGDTWLDRARAFTLALRARLGPRFLALRTPRPPPD